MSASNLRDWFAPLLLRNEINHPELMLQREQMLTAIWVTSITLGSAALVLTVIRALSEAQHFLTIFVFVAYFWPAVCLIWRRRISFNIRALGTVFMAYMVGLLALLILGPVSVGLLWLLVFSTLASVIFGTRAAYYSIAFICITMIGLGWALWDGTLPWLEQYDITMFHWLVISINVLLIISFMSVAVAFFFNSLALALARESASRHSSEQYNSRLLVEQQIRMDAEQSLRKSEEKYRLLVENAQEGILVLQDDMIKFINPYVSHMSGFTWDDLASQPFLEFIHPEDRLRVLEYYGRRLAGEELAQRNSVRIFDKAGRTKWLEVVGRLIEWEGRPANLVFASDFTERIQAEQALRESEERFRVLLQGIPSVAVQGYGPDGTTQYWNKASERLYGYTESEAIGRNLLDLIIPPEMADEVQNAIKTMIETGEPIPAAELSLKHKDGSRVEVFSSHAVVMRPGRTPELFCLDVDISERKRTENELRKSQAFNSSIVESSTDCIKVLDLEGRLKYMSPGGLRLMEVEDFSSLAGLTCEQLWQGPHLADMRRALAEARLGGRGNFRGYCATATAKDKWWDVTITPIRNLEGEVDRLLAISRDITQAKMAEDRVKVALAEKEVLLKEIHHRVKNNLQVVSSLLKLQAMQVADKRLLDTLRVSQTRVQAMALVHESLYRSETLATVDLEAYISRLAKAIMQAYPEAKDRIHLKVEAQGIEAGIDQAAPVGLLINELVTNSLKYAFGGEAGGEIVIRARHLEEGLVELVIADDGVGLPPDLDWRNPPSLGLQLVKDLVEQQLEGSMELLDGPGACYRIRIQTRPQGK